MSAETIWNEQKNGWHIEQIYIKSYSFIILLIDDFRMHKIIIWNEKLCFFYCRNNQFFIRIPINHNSICILHTKLSFQMNTAKQCYVFRLSTGLNVSKLSCHLRRKSRRRKKFIRSILSNDISRWFQWFAHLVSVASFTHTHTLQVVGNVTIGNLIFRTSKWKCLIFLLKIRK